MPETGASRRDGGGAGSQPGRVCVENNGKTLGDVDEGRFVTGKERGALRGHQRCKRVRSSYSTSMLLKYAVDKVRRDRDISET